VAALTPGPLFVECPIKRLRLRCHKAPEIEGVSVTRASTSTSRHVWAGPCLGVNELLKLLIGHRFMHLLGGSFELALGCLASRRRGGAGGLLLGGGFGGHRILLPEIAERVAYRSGFVLESDWGEEQPKRETLTRSVRNKLS
jgi:hypothetical protein